MLHRTLHNFFHTGWLLRSLFLMFVGLILAGGVAISVVENLELGESLYFAFVTGLTVGYGDIAPVSPTGRIISVILGFVGILFTGLVVAVATYAVRQAREEIQHES